MIRRHQNTIELNYVKHSIKFGKMFTVHSLNLLSMLIADRIWFETPMCANVITAPPACATTFVATVTKTVFVFFFVHLNLNSPIISKSMKTQNSFQMRNLNWNMWLKIIESNNDLSKKMKVNPNWLSSDFNEDFFVSRYFCCCDEQHWFLRSLCSLNGLTIFYHFMLF